MHLVCVCVCVFVCVAGLTREGGGIWKAESGFEMKNRQPTCMKHGNRHTLYYTHTTRPNIEQLVLKEKALVSITHYKTVCHNNVPDVVLDKVVERIDVLLHKTFHLMDIQKRWRERER